jgi:cytidylate kinase
VFPDADIKIFMTASPEIRARRRFDELSARGVEVDFDKILENVNYRDSSDSGREISPLRKASDAIELDNSDMTLDDQMDWFRDLLESFSNEN